MRGVSLATMMAELPAVNHMHQPGMALVYQEKEEFFYAGGHS